MIPDLRLALPASDSARGAHGLPALPAAADRPEQARFQLFDTISTLLRSAAAANPLVVIVDDLHVADPDSLLLLRFLARDLTHARILCIGTYREIEVSRSGQHIALIGEIIREAKCLPLRGLDSEQIALLVQRGLGVKAERQLLESLSATTEGNLFFLDEIVRLMRAESGLASTGPSGAPFNLPDSIRTTVRRRLGPVLDHARLALAIASVIGHEFEFSVLSQVSELTEEQLSEALDQAIALGL